MTGPGTQLDYFQRIFNAFDDMVFVLDRSAFFLDYMPPNSQKLVMPKEAFIGKNISDILPPSICESIQSGISELENELSDCYRFEYSLMLGSLRWYSANITRIKKSGDEEDQFLAVVRDITDSKENQLLLRDILHYSQHGVIYLKALNDDQGRLTDFECVLFNEEAARLSKKCPDQLKNARLSSFLDPRWFPHFFVVLARTHEKGEPFSEIRNYQAAADEPPLWASITISRLNDGVLVNIYDITDQVILNDQLHQSNDNLKNLNIEKDEILSALTHDLRGPLSGITGLLRLLRSEKPDEDEQNNYYSMLETSAFKMENMLLELLNWQNSEMDEDAKPGTTFNWHQEVKRLLEEMVQAQHKKIRLLNQVPVEHTRTGNHGMVCSILRNLIHNAVKFSHPGSEIRIDAHSENGYFILTVEDFGIGMTAEQIHNLLNSGLPISTLGTSGEKGTGMGIRIIKGFIEKMGGKLAIESTPGKGSRFRVSLPVKQ